MQDTNLVCSLTAADYRDRETAWLKLGDYISASAPIAGGLSFTFVPIQGLRESLTELIRLEAECCAWMSFALSESSQGIGLAITSDTEDGQRGVREAFAPLVRSSGV
ncbi:MAG: hypothetical protein M3Z28_12590 [Candidatus Dormibacteraeota bacterium]|nr:hypothetical protein [Candidatus Dormibacteraeota bacterium]